MSTHRWYLKRRSDGKYEGYSEWVGRTDEFAIKHYSAAEAFDRRNSNYSLATVAVVRVTRKQKTRITRLVPKCKPKFEAHTAQNAIAWWRSQPEVVLADLLRGMWAAQRPLPEPVECGHRWITQTGPWECRDCKAPFRWTDDDGFVLDPRRGKDAGAQRGGAGECGHEERRIFGRGNLPVRWCMLCGATKIGEEEWVLPKRAGAFCKESAKAALHEAIRRWLTTPSQGTFNDFAELVFADIDAGRFPGAEWRKS